MLHALGHAAGDLSNTSAAAPTLVRMTIDFGADDERTCRTGGGGGAGIPKTIHSGCALAQHKRGRGAPKGNRNALKHGRYRREMRELSEFVRARLRAARNAIAAAKESLTLSSSKGEAEHARKKGER